MEVIGARVRQKNGRNRSTREAAQLLTSGDWRAPGHDLTAAGRASSRLRIRRPTAASFQLLSSAAKTHGRRTRLERAGGRPGTAAPVACLPGRERQLESLLDRVPFPRADPIGEQSSQLGRRMRRAKKAISGEILSGSASCACLQQQMRRIH